MARGTGVRRTGWSMRTETSPASANRPTLASSSATNQNSRLLRIRWENRSRMSDSWLTRCSLVTLVTMGLLAPIFVWGTLMGSQGMRNAPIRWIPSSHAELRRYEDFLEEFRAQQGVIVSWPGCTVDDERLRHFRDAILSERKNAHGEDFTDLFQQVVSGYTMLQYLRDEPFLLSRTGAIARLKGTLVGPQANTSCAVVILTAYGARHSQSVVDTILDVVETDLGISQNDCFLGGSPVDSAAIDAASARSVKYFLIPSTIVVLLLGRLCLGSWPLTLIVVTTALFGEAFVLGLVYFCGVTMNAVLTVMAPLILVLTVSAGVHLVNYYRDESRLRGRHGAVQRALASAWAPCALAALTTAIGLASLTVSNIVPVGQFGWFAGIGILSTTALLFLVVPGLMVKWPVASKPATHNVENAGLAIANFGSAWDRLSALVSRYSTVILVVCVAWMSFSLWGLTKIKTSVNVLSLLSSGSRTVRDYKWLEGNVAPMVPIEIVVSVGAQCELDLLEQLELVRQIQAELEELEHLEGTMSAATFFPSIPGASGIRRMARRVLLKKKLEKQRQALVDTHYLYEPGGTNPQSPDDRLGGRSWRISARAPAIANLDYGLFLERIRNRVQPLLDSYDEQGDSSISATYTGIMPVVFNVQRLLLSDLIRSYATALLLVALVMVFVQRSVLGGLVVMLPNTFPTFVLFGTMGWLQKPGRYWLNDDRQCGIGNRGRWHTSFSLLVSPRNPSGPIAARRSRSMLPALRASHYANRNYLRNWVVGLFVEWLFAYASICLDDVRLASCGIDW